MRNTEGEGHTMENTVLRDGHDHHVGYNPFVVSVDQFVKCVLLERCVCIVWLKTCVYIQKESQNRSVDLGSAFLSVRSTLRTQAKMIWKPRSCSETLYEYGSLCLM